MTDARAEQGGQVGLVRHGHIPLEGRKMRSMLEPGMFVRHPARPDWGLGQVQSNVSGKITVNFEHAGKVVIDEAVVQLSVDYSV